MEQILTVLEIVANKHKHNILRKFQSQFSFHFNNTIRNENPSFSRPNFTSIIVQCRYSLFSITVIFSVSYPLISTQHKSLTFYYRIGRVSTCWITDFLNSCLITETEGFRQSTECQLPLVERLPAYGLWLPPLHSTSARYSITLPVTTHSSSYRSSRDIPSCRTQNVVDSNGGGWELERWGLENWVVFSVSLFSGKAYTLLHTKQLL